MAPEPAWADMASAAGAQRGSFAVEIGVLDRGVLEVGVADVGSVVLAAVVGDDLRVDEDAVVATRRVGDGDVADRFMGAVDAAVARVVASVVGTEIEELVAPDP